MTHNTCVRHASKLDVRLVLTFLGKIAVIVTDMLLDGLGGCRVSPSPALISSPAAERHIVDVVCHYCTRLQAEGQAAAFSYQPTASRFYHCLMCCCLHSTLMIVKGQLSVHVHTSLCVGCTMHLLTINPDHACPTWHPCILLHSRLLCCC